MKVIVILTLYLISGPVGCIDVVGYSGGSVLVYCGHQMHGLNRKFCKDSEQQCVYLESDQNQNTWDHGDRVYLHESAGSLQVIFRELSVQDAGSYLCGPTGEGNMIVNLKVNTDPCCTKKKTLTGHLGKTVTISCSYPEEFKEDSEESEERTKFFEKMDGRNFTKVIRTTDTQKGRFSISEDRRSKVLRMRIRDVREDDGGVYFCGVERGDYEVFFTEIQLQVTAPNSSGFTKLFSCVALLLIGGSALIIYTVIRKKRRGSTPPSSRMELKDNQEVTLVEIEHTRCVSASDTGVNANNANKDICSTIPPPKDEGLTYATVVFQKNLDSPSNTPVTNSKEELAIEYTSVKHEGLE
ncbi:hypothetical protein MHYP_G00104710 [Metynnis hypsauchen]